MKSTSRSGKPPAEFMVICFELPSGSHDDWNIRVAQVLNLNSNLLIPIMFRFLISKEEISDEDFENYYKGFVTINTYNILIYRERFKDLQTYLSGVQDDLPGYFVKKDLESVKATFRSYFTLRSDSEAESILEFQPASPLSPSAPPSTSDETLRCYALLLAWMRKNGISSPFSHVTKEFSQSLGKLNEWLASTKENAGNAESI